MSVPPSIAALASRTGDFGLLLENWANVNSGSGNAVGLNRMLGVLREQFGQSFPSAQIEELSADAPGWNPAGVRALRVRMRPQAAQQIFLCGHFDTVYEVDDAFQTCRWIDAITLNGPGTADMKGGLVVILAALEAFEKTAGAEKLGWEVLLTPDEETGSHGTIGLLRGAGARHQFGLVFEPARPNGDIVQSRKGTGQFNVTCHGRAAHAAKFPNDGRNAVLALAEFLLEVNKIPAEMPGVMVNVANFHGGSVATNVVPALAKAEIDVRITQVSDRAPLKARFEALAAMVNAKEGFRLELAGGFNRPPKEYGPKEQAVYAAWQLAARDVGVPPFTWIHTGGSIGRKFSERGWPGESRWTRAARGISAQRPGILSDRNDRAARADRCVVYASTGERRSDVAAGEIAVIHRG